MFEYVHVLIPIIGLIVNVAMQILVFRSMPRLTLLKSIIVGFAFGSLSVIILEYALWALLLGSAPDVFSKGIVNLLSYTALGYCYFHFVNLGETARRIRILRELYERPEGLTPEEILARYNAKHIVDLRLRRLLHNHQVIEGDGKYYIGKPIMLFIAKSITLLKLLILGKKSEFD
jgi:hypothetical protein